MASAEGLPQTGQVEERWTLFMPVLDDPFCRTQRGVDMQDQGTPRPSREVWQRLGIRLKRGDHSGGGAQWWQTMRDGGMVCRDLPQSDQTGSMRTRQQFVQRRMNTRPDDLGKPKCGEAEQAWA